TIGTYAASTGFDADPSVGGPTDATAAAAGLAAAINSDANSPVTASASSNVLTVTSKVPGPQGNNITLSFLCVNDDAVDFPTPDFSATYPATLSGGVDGSGANGSTPSINTPLVTVYSYDPLDNLTKVFQGQQQRIYSYDSVGRLLSAQTPESGTTSYTYTDYSSVATRPDARNAVTSYQYDGLHRLVGVHYDLSQATGVSAMPDVCTSATGQLANVCFTYGTSAASNNNGRVTAMTDPTGGEAY